MQMVDARQAKSDLFIKGKLHRTTCDLHKDIAKGQYYIAYGYMALWSYITLTKSPQLMSH